MTKSDWDYRGLAAECYDLWFGDEPFWDQAFFHDRLRHNSGVALEIACGTGRLLVPFLRDGLAVEGVDASAEMLAICRTKAAYVGVTPTLYQQLMQDLDLASHYRTVFMPACSFQILAERDEAFAALRRFYTHLELGGTLLITLMVPWRDFGVERLELLKEAVPTLSRIAVLWNAADPGMVLRFREIEAAARVLGVTLQSLEVRSPQDFERAFTAVARERPDALFVVAEVLTLSHRCQVLDFAAQNRLPAMYEFGVFAREGGLMAYGPKLTDSFQRGAYYVDKVLKGTRPADLPIEQPMNFELVVNLKAAEALGLTFPSHLLLLAERGDQDQENRCGRIW
jgi:SAM-dependent methyltransferase